MTPANPNETAAERVEAQAKLSGAMPDGTRFEVEVRQSDLRTLLTERTELLARVAEHERTITRMHRQAATSRRFWIRDAEEALAGKPQSLRNRIEMAKSDPVDVVLSDAALAKDQPQTHPLDQERGR